jgi:hypothetical protein
LLSDALATAINLYVKLNNERFGLEIQMNYIPPFDAKLVLLTRMQLEVTRILVPFLDYFHQFGIKKVHMVLVLMFDPQFKDISIMNHY